MRAVPDVARRPHDPRAEPRPQLVLGVARRTAVPLSIMLLGAALAYLAWWGTSLQRNPDTDAYQLVAQHLRDAGTIDHLEDRTPGYPVVLLLTNSTSHLQPSLLLLQLTGHLATVWMVIALGRRFALPRRWSLVLAAGLLSPPLVENAWYGLSESTSEVLLVGAVLSAVRWIERDRRIDALTCGALLGVLALVRPTFQLLGISVAAAAGAWIWHRGRRREAVRAFGLLGLGGLLCVGGVVALNATRFDYPGFSPLLGWNLSTRTVLFVEDLPDDDAEVRAVLVEGRDRALLSGSHTGLMYVWAVRPQVEAASGLERPQSDIYMLRLNLRLIRDHPLEYLDAVGTASASYVMPSSTPQATGGSRALQLVFAVAHLVTLVAFVGQLLGVVALSVARRLGAPIAGPADDPIAVRTWLLAMACIAYTWIVSVTTEVGNPRYRTPTDALILLVAFGGSFLVVEAMRGAQEHA